MMKRFYRKEKDDFCTWLSCVCMCLGIICVMNKRGFCAHKTSVVDNKMELNMGITKYLHVSCELQQFAFSVLLSWISCTVQHTGSTHSKRSKTTWTTSILKYQAEYVWNSSKARCTQYKIKRNLNNNLSALLLLSVFAFSRYFYRL